LFQPFGELERIFFPSNSTGRTQKGNYAFVEFKQPSFAQKAMEKIHGRKLLERNLVVRPAHERSQNMASRTISSLGTTSHLPLQTVKKQKNEVENKIEAVKRAIEENKRRI
jgi:RNA recognition motif-containing protein